MSALSYCREMTLGLRRLSSLLVASALLVGFPLDANAAFTYAPGLGMVEDAGNGLLNVQVPDGTILVTHGPDTIIPRGLVPDVIEEPAEGVTAAESDASENPHPPRKTRSRRPPRARVATFVA